MPSPVWSLPVYLDMNLIPGSYAVLLFTALDFTSITSHIHNRVLFLLWLHLFILSGVISPLISSSNWAPTNLGSSSFSVLFFCLFILFMGFSRQEYWSGLPFPSPVDHILSELSTTTRPSWVALHGMAHSFTQLDKAVVHVIRLISFLWFLCFCVFCDFCVSVWVFSLSALWWRRIRGLWKLPDWIDWLRGKLGPVLMGGRAQFTSVQSPSRVQLFATPWTAAYQGPPSMGDTLKPYSQKTSQSNHTDHSIV